MMSPRATISAFPGHSCVFWQRGRCMIRERLNPGLDQSLRCRVLKRWELAFDELVDRAEAFGLEDEQASRIWERKLEEMIRRGAQCLDFELWSGDLADEEEAPAIACQHVFGDLCLLTLPRCEGVCKRFLSRRESVGRAGPSGPSEPEEE